MNQPLPGERAAPARNVHLQNNSFPRPERSANPAPVPRLAQAGAAGAGDQVADHVPTPTIVPGSGPRCPARPGSPAPRGLIQPGAPTGIAQGRAGGGGDKCQRRGRAHRCTRRGCVLSTAKVLTARGATARRALGPEPTAAIRDPCLPAEPPSRRRPRCPPPARHSARAAAAVVQPWRRQQTSFSGLPAPPPGPKRRSQSGVAPL